MDAKDIEDLIKEITTSYASGEGGENGWLIVGKANKEKAELIIRKHFEQSENKNEIIKLKAELEIYKQIISKSNFATILIKEDL